MVTQVTKRTAGLVIFSILMPGGIPLALAALVADRLWPGRFTAVTPWREADR